MEISESPTPTTISVVLVQGRKFLAMALVFSSLAIWLQWRSGVYEAELNGYPDEAAHLITGLMVRDYVVSGFGQSPIKFAETYYLHYPKVGFGIWPPLFHFVEAAWFLVTPPGKISAFVLQGLITGSLAAALTSLALPFGPWMALAAGVAFVGLPTVQLFTGMVMADNLMCLISFAAMVSFAWYAERWQRRFLLLFGLLAGMALMTKSNAAGLGLLPLIALVLLGQWRRIVSPAMFVAGAIALAVALPWQIMVIGLWTKTITANKYSVDYVIQMLQVHSQMYFNLPGIVIVLLAVAGFVKQVVTPWRVGQLKPLWASVTGLVVGMFLFGLAPLPPEPRYHVASLAGIVLFSAAGLHWMATKAAGRWGRWAEPACLLVAAALYGMTTFTIPQRYSLGYGDVARRIIENTSYRDSVVLVSAQNLGEGLMISEIALLELRPSHYILRATKMLSTSKWNLANYELRYDTPEKVEAFLESIPVRLVVYDTARGLMPMKHHELLNQVLEKNPEKWVRIGVYPPTGVNAEGGRVELYELKGYDKVRGPIKIDLPYTLQRIIK